MGTLRDLFKNGNASRKFALVIFAIVLLTGITISCAWSNGIAGVLTSFIGGLTGLVAAYMGGNAVSKFADNRKHKECKCNDCKEE